MTWITHPFIRPGSLESRAYQLSIAMRALDGNNGGSFEEVVIADAGHSPYVEKPEEFMAHFTKVLK